MLNVVDPAEHRSLFHLIKVAELSECARYMRKDNNIGSRDLDTANKKPCSHMRIQEINQIFG